MRRLVALVQDHHTRNSGVYQFMKFGVTGVIGATIDFGIFTLLTRVGGLYFVYANLISVFIAICFTFLSNKFWTFRSKTTEAMHKQTVKFFIIAAISYTLQQLLLWVFVHHLPLERYVNGYEDLVAKAMAILIVMFNTFFSNKYWTFRAQKVQAQTSLPTPPSQV